MLKLTVFSGWSGSGKTTAALDCFWRADERPLVLIESDRIRMIPGSDATGQLIALALWHARCGSSVIVDAVNLHVDDYCRWSEAAGGFDAFEWITMPTSLDECIRRDALRPFPVGRDAIALQGHDH